MADGARLGGTSSGWAGDVPAEQIVAITASHVLPPSGGEFNEAATPVEENRLQGKKGESDLQGLVQHRTDARM